jgi:hypothetical protein
MPNQEDGSRVETIAKTAAGVIAGAYALGLIISNMFLSSFGASDFAVIRPRLVLVGIAFVLYLTLPVCLGIVPTLIIARALRQRRLPAILRIALAVLALATLIVVLPLPFDIFLWSLPHYSRLAFWVRFWREIYGSLWQWPYIVGLIVVPLYILGLKRTTNHNLPAKWRVALIGAIIAGVLSQIYAYSTDVYPAVEPAAGGGHPDLVEVFFSPAIQAATSGRLPNGNYLLWHATPESLVLTGANLGPVTRAYVVPSREVVPMFVRDAHVRLRDDVITSVIAHDSPPNCDTPQSFAAPPQ